MTMPETALLDDGRWSTAHMVGDSLTFDSANGFNKALRDGFFLVKAPICASFEAGDRFAQNFYRMPDGGPHDIYRGFARWTERELGNHEGYFARDTDQTEQFFLERSYWDRIYPLPLVHQAEQLRSLALQILCGVLARLDIPRHLWGVATGGAVDGKGVYHLTFNHFRPEVRARGLNVHKDSGWVTVLRSLQPGLEVFAQGEWTPIDPLPGYYIVNFGCAFEILTRNLHTPVAAVPHRVREQTTASNSEKPDRFSYALFVDSSLDENVCAGLYSYGPNTGLSLEMGFKDFLDKIIKNTYQQDTVGLY